MLSTNRFALKEWAVVQAALAEGRQILLLRKGGLIESRGGFTVEHPEFFIYPTFLHQQRDGIVPSAQKTLEPLLSAKRPDVQVTLSHYAVVRDHFRITDPARLERLSGLQCFNNAEVQKRFSYGRKPGLHLLMLRVYSLPVPILLPERPQYAGCRSWVDLEENIPTAGSRPVLDEDAFDSEYHRIIKLIR